MNCHRADRQPVTCIFLFWADVSRSHFLAKILIQQELLHCLITSITQALSIAHQTLLDGGAGITWDFVLTGLHVCKGVKALQNIYCITSEWNTGEKSESLV